MFHQDAKQCECSGAGSIPAIHEYRGGHSEPCPFHRQDAAPLYGVLVVGEPADNRMKWLAVKADDADEAMHLAAQCTHFGWAEWRPVGAARADTFLLNMQSQFVDRVSA